MSGLGDWITTSEGAKLTGYSSTYVRMLAGQGRIRARHVGRDWLVSREDLLAHKAKMDALGTDKHNPWREDLDNGRGRK
jgi:excisionase family DNA binding protein